MPHPLAMFDQVRIINLVDRPDRRREMTAQMARIGGVDGDHVAFFPVHRPSDPGDFPSLGARGCFESHLAVLRAARDADAGSLLLLEDDMDFAPDFETRGPIILEQLRRTPCSFFYGSHREAPRGRAGCVSIPAEEGIITAAFLAFDGAVLAPLVAFMEEMLTRPAGSPDYGPMHVDGAYSVYRALHPERKTCAAFPPLGRQRASRSDITESGMILDRFGPTRPLANLLRRVRDAVRG